MDTKHTKNQDSMYFLWECCRKFQEREKLLAKKRCLKRAKGADYGVILEGTADKNH